MKFEFYRFRFHFRACGALYFPPYQSGNIIRGAFGSIFRRLVCVTDCKDAKNCDMRNTCPYARIFEPRPTHSDGPSGLRDRPRPFVFRVSHLDGTTISDGCPFHFDVHIFDVRDPGVAYFVKTFAEFAHEGLGPGRSRVDLVAADQLELGSSIVSRIFESERRLTGELYPPIQMDLGDQGDLVDHVKVRFVTPTELKSEQRVTKRVDFAILFGRLRDRISTLRATYGAGPLDIEFGKMGERAATVRVTRSELEYVDVGRRSSRTGQVHPLGGFIGEIEYSGELTEFMSYLRLGRWVGVGRQTVWGKGEIQLGSYGSIGQGGAEAPLL